MTLHPIHHRMNSLRRAGRTVVARGFTLIEVLATVSILGAIGSVASYPVMSSLDGYMKAATQAQLHTELSITMDRIERELRKIPFKPSYGSIAPDISTVTASSIAWNSNYSLTLSSGRVMFVDNGSASSILLDNATGFVVQTYNESNAALAASLSGAACDPIRRVSIQMTVQRAGITETLRSKFFLRLTMEGAG